MADELMQIVVKSPAFAEDRPIPVKYTGDGADVSPPLTWSGVPHGTRSLVVLCEDPDAPRGTWTHWVLFNLPPQTRELPEGVAAQATLPDGSVQGHNDFGKVGYGGPAPPPGMPHRYYFKVAALNITLTLPAGARRQDVLAAMEGHVLGEGWLMGVYGRKAGK
jgi:Raf kinase inhibitor-like YbhB/YbcL family protein